MLIKLMVFATLDADARVKFNCPSLERKGNCLCENKNVFLQRTGVVAISRFSLFFPSLNFSLSGITTSFFVDNYTSVAGFHINCCILLQKDLVLKRQYWTRYNKFEAVLVVLLDILLVLSFVTLLFSIPVLARLYA